jgi:hypothetical protein
MNTYTQRFFALALAGAAYLALAGVAAADPLNPLDFPSLGSPTLPDGFYIIDTDAVQITGPNGFVTLPGTLAGNSRAVFAFASFRAGPGVSLFVHGRRPVALLSAGDLIISGGVGAGGASGASGGNSTVANPGRGGNGGAGSADGNDGAVGGSGAVTSGNPGFRGAGVGGGLGGNSYGFGTNGGGLGGGGGGNGGHGGGTSFAPGSGGITYGDPLASPEGGSGGGGGGSSGGAAGGGGGGAGGGALELGALGTVDLRNSSITLSGGTGGQGGSGNNVAQAGGGGGGSGGSLLIHGSIILMGQVDASGGDSANDGGGGGGGRVSTQSVAPPDVSGVDVSGGSGAFNHPGASGFVFTTVAALAADNVEFGAVPVGSSKTGYLIVRNSGGEYGALNGRVSGTSGEIEGVTAGNFSSSLNLDNSSFDRQASHVVDGQGFEIGGPGTHSSAADGSMWLSAGVGFLPGVNDPSPFIAFDLGAVRSVASMRVWNYNEAGGNPQPFTRRGIHTCTLRVSDNGVAYTSLGTITLNQAPGDSSTDFSQLVPVNATARYIALTDAVSFGSDSNFVGLSEVRFNAGPTPFGRVGTGRFTGLRAGEVRAIPFTFTPTMEGSFAQTVTVNSNGGAVTVTVHGTGGGTTGGAFCDADVGVTGGIAGHDGVLDNNDFIVYIDTFFNHTGCP